MKMQGLEIEPHMVRDRGSKREFVRLLNDFREEYYEGAAPFEITLDMLADNPGVIPIMYKHKGRTVAIAETCIGRAYGKPTLGVAVVYVKPSLRNSGIAAVVYNHIEQTASEIDANMMFNIQVEKSKFDKYRDKFIALGFTHYQAIEEFANGRDYKEVTYALFRQHHGIKSLLCINPLLEAA